MAFTLCQDITDGELQPESNWKQCVLHITPRVGINNVTAAVHHVSSMMRKISPACCSFKRFFTLGCKYASMEHAVAIYSSLIHAWNIHLVKLYFTCRQYLLLNVATYSYIVLFPNHAFLLQFWDMKHTAMIWSVSFFSRAVI